MSTPHATPTTSSPILLTASNIVGGNYRVGEKIGEGSCGVVFEGLKVTSAIPVAIKFEPRKSDTPQLCDESRCYRILSGTPGVPQLHHFGQEGLHNVLVIDLLGHNLEDLFNMCGRKFSIKTVCMAAKQMITRIQAVHDRSLICRDIKPENFLVGVPGTRKVNMIHIINFGIAKHYRDPKTNIHIPYRERRPDFGITRYTSINAHLGREKSRRDDLESLGYIFMYFLRGRLPWQGLQAATSAQKYKKIGKKKQTTLVSELCEGFPEEFAVYINYVRKLGFEEDPNYDFLRELFTNVMKTIGEPEDAFYDWMLLNGGRGLQNTSTSLVLTSSATLAREYRCESVAAGASQPLQNPATPLVLNSSATQTHEHRRELRSGESLKTMYSSAIPKTPTEVAGIRGQELMIVMDLLIRHATKLTNQPDFHEIDHFTLEFGNRDPQPIELDIEGWEQTLRPFLNVLDKLLVPSKIDTLMDLYCQQCQFFQITFDILTHLKSLREREEPDVEKYLESLEEIIKYGGFDLNFGRVFFGSAAIVGSLMAVLAHRR